MTSEIVVSDGLQKLKEEINLLKITLSELFQERDNLTYHICPELRAKYAKEIGDYQNRANNQELLILELKRKIEITRAALNREKTISQESVAEQVEQEYQEFRQKVNDEYRQSKDFQKEQEEKEKKRRYYEEQWKNKYSNAQNGHDTEEESEANDYDDFDADASKRNESPSAKDLYRKIVKKLHPDMNPDATEREMELFRKAVSAYEEGDILTLQEIYDEIYASGEEANIQPETLDDLIALRDGLQEQISRVMQEIELIKQEFPYTEIEFLNDPEAVKAKRDAIFQLIREYEAEIERLSQLLQEMNQEIEELRKKKEAYGRKEE